MKYCRSIGNNIYNIMEQKSISVETLSEETGFSENDIERIFNGRLILSYKDLEAICSVLDINIEDTLKVSDENSFVHCNGEFKDIENREKILDIIDSYIDVVEMVS